MYVLDATPLIYLATTDRLELLADLPEPCVLPEAVYEEVVTEGVSAGHADARRVQRAVEDGWLTVVSVEGTAPEADAPFETLTSSETAIEIVDRLTQNDRLSRADAEVLAFAGSREATAVMDEAYGRAIADAEDILTRGTAYLVLEALHEGTIDAEEARDVVDAMVDAGWYCAPDRYAAILRRIDELA